MNVQAAKIINSHGVHVLIDLTGYTLDPKMEVLSLLPAGKCFPCNMSSVGTVLSASEKFYSHPKGLIRITLLSHQSALH